MGMRRIGSTQRKTQRAKTRRRNNVRKARSEVARARWMASDLQGKSLPFDPFTMIRLGATLRKSPRAITQADVDGIIARAPV